MIDNDLPKSVRQFIATYFQSVEQIEVLLLLYGHQEREWSAEEVDQKVRSSPTSIDSRLNSLADQKFLTRRSEGSSHFRYEPQNEELNQQVAMLAEHYKTRRNRVIEAIYSSPTQKMLNLRDAFKVKKDDDYE